MARIAIVGPCSQAFAGALSDRGHSVSVVNTEPEREALFEDPHDLVIVSDCLESASGLEFVAQLRNVCGPERLPVVVLTSGSEASYVRGFAAGASDCLAMDVSSPVLLAKCARLLAQTAQGPVPARSAPVEGDLLFERYRIDKFLGEGTYGAVYAATDSVSGEEVALKILSNASDPESKRRFLRETYVMASARGPNLVPVTHSGIEAGLLYYAMGRVRGISVHESVRRNGAATEEQAVALLRGLANALALLEKAGLLHRDVKPANIILAGESFSSPVLVDFGLAKRPLDRGITSAGVMLGTPGYMAPEYLDSDAIDSRSDLFSAGMVVLFACKGAEPFPPLSGVQLLTSMAERPIPIPVELSVPFKALLRDLTRIDPQHRIGSAAELLRRLDALDRRRRRRLGAPAPLPPQDAS